MRILVALATYNEIENLPSLVEAIRKQLRTADILVVDDNSPDGTGQWCDDFAEGRPWFRCIHRPSKLGLGSAAWAAMQHAIDADYEWLVTMDADWSHPPESLPDLKAATENADVVIGSRYCPGGGVENWPLHRRMLSRVMNFATRLAIGGDVFDASGAYRMYRVAKLRQIEWSKLRSTGYAYLEEILWRLSRLDARIVETPIVFTDRVAGHSKAGLGEAWGKLRALRRVLWRRIRDRN